MAKTKPLSELSPAYRKRLESARLRGVATRAEARGHKPANAPELPRFPGLTKFFSELAPTTQKRKLREAEQKGLIETRKRERGKIVPGTGSGFTKLSEHSKKVIDVKGNQNVSYDVFQLDKDLLPLWLDFTNSFLTQLEHQGYAVYRITALAEYTPKRKRDYPVRTVKLAEYPGKDIVNIFSPNYEDIRDRSNVILVEDRMQKLSIAEPLRYWIEARKITKRR